MNVSSVQSLQVGSVVLWSYTIGTTEPMFLSAIVIGFYDSTVYILFEDGEVCDWDYLWLFDEDMELIKV